MIPLVLLAGFLGAGKTSFLRQILPLLGQAGLRPRVVLNDYENAGVDAATLTDLVTRLVPVSGSCLCCESLEALLDALCAITPAADGQDIVLVETNGTTDTGTLLETLSATPRLAHLGAPLQVTVVDAQRFARRGWQDQMEEEQIATATDLYLSRTDLVDAGRVQEVQTALRRVAPRAVLTSAPAFVARVARRDDAGLEEAPTTDGPPPAVHVHDGRHHFAALQLPVAAPVDEAAFLQFLHDLPAEVIRAKGIICLREPRGEKRVFQKVGDWAEISPCQLAEPELLQPVAIFVGVGIPSLVVRARLAKLLA